MKIGIAGTGRMGTAIAARLLGLGHEVAVWNRGAAKTRPLAEAGAGAAATPAQLVRGSECIVTALADAAAIDAVYAQMLSAGVRGKLFIDMSTVRPQTQRSLAARLKAQGAAFVECPVGGSVGPAKEGRLFGFAGGDAADVARARPLLEQLCRRIEHVGPVGAGSAVKLAVNLPMMVYWQALGEALALVAPLGLEPQRLVGILADTSGAPDGFKSRAAIVAAALAGSPPAAASFDVDSMLKDLRAMVEEAKSLGRALPVTERALECVERAVREGLGGADCSMLPVHFTGPRGSSPSPQG
jgi:3-hydroxyisobutyrate dehydrogenase